MSVSDLVFGFAASLMYLGASVGLLVMLWRVARPERRSSPVASDVPSIVRNIGVLPWHADGGQSACSALARSVDDVLTACGNDGISGTITNTKAGHVYYVVVVRGDTLEESHELFRRGVEQAERRRAAGGGYVH